MAGRIGHPPSLASSVIELGKWRRHLEQQLQEIVASVSFLTWIYGAAVLCWLKLHRWRASRRFTHPVTRLVLVCAPIAHYYVHIPSKARCLSCVGLLSSRCRRVDVHWLLIWLGRVACGCAGS
jgi:hypothetical protein